MYINLSPIVLSLTTPDKKLYLEIGGLYITALALYTELVPSGRAGGTSTAGITVVTAVSSSPAGSSSLEETGTLAAGGYVASYTYGLGS